MELIILGFLVVKSITIYEMRKLIDLYFTSMCSSSTGSIQTAVKKLLDAGMITFDEYVENGKNKKVYEITPKGRDYFKSKVSEPMSNKEKNIELSKLYYMGFIPEELRFESIDSYIADLVQEREMLKQILLSKQSDETIVESFISLFEADNTIDMFKEMLPTESVADGLKDIIFFQYASLELGIAKLTFVIDWFEDLKKRMGQSNK